MIKPAELDNDEPQGPWRCKGNDIWRTLVAAESGDTATLDQLLTADPNLARSGYWYTQPLHFAVREGHLAAVQRLLAAGGDPTTVDLSGQDLMAWARERGHEAVAQLLEAEIARQGLVKPGNAPEENPLHLAVAAGDFTTVHELLDRNPERVASVDRTGGTALHRAVSANRPDMVIFMLRHGADIHAVHAAAPGGAEGYPAVGFQPIDLALWSSPFWGRRKDDKLARLLVEHGAECDIVIAAALGDLDRVKALLADDPSRVRATRRTGKHALPAAVEYGHEAIARLLLEHGADPNWPDGDLAPRGSALHSAARSGDQALVDLLLDHGADPNGSIDSVGSATFSAKTAAIRRQLVARGGVIDTYDLVWLGEDDEVVRRVTADPRAADDGCGGVFAAACTQGKTNLVVRLIAAGARVPPVLTACRGYLLSDPETLKLLLDSGMDPNLPNWVKATPLHELCGRDGRGRANPMRVKCAPVLLDAGADINARDEDYRSTPLAWAARNDLMDMVVFLLNKGAATNLPDDPEWATPLAWATRRNHRDVVDLLRTAGAKR